MVLSITNYNILYKMEIRSQIRDDKFTGKSVSKRQGNYNKKNRQEVNFT